MNQDEPEETRTNNSYQLSFSERFLLAVTALIALLAAGWVYTINTGIIDPAIMNPKDFMAPLAPEPTLSHS